MSQPPELIVKGAPIDFALSELLGEPFSDFIVLCIDGEQVPFMGTPYDSPAERENQRIGVEARHGCG